MFGGPIGATVAEFGWAGVNWSGDGSKIDGVVGKVMLPAVLSPMVAGIVSTVGTWLVYRTAAVGRRGPPRAGWSPCG